MSVLELAAMAPASAPVTSLYQSRAVNHVLETPPEAVQVKANISSLVGYIFATCTDTYASPWIYIVAYLIGPILEVSPLRVVVRHHVLSVQVTTDHDTETCM